MKEPESNKEREALSGILDSSYMEVFPTPSVEKELHVLEPNAYIAVTCSPTKDISETIEMTERLVDRGFRVIPHIAARNVRDKQHLKSIMSRLRDLKIESLFVPGGDAPHPAGEFSSAFELLRAISEYDHRLKDIGVAAYPEGHTSISDGVLFDELMKKQELATCMITQMCFDAGVFGKWLARTRDQGLTLPVLIGMPGVVDRVSLLKTSMRIGVGDSLRFLRKNARLATKFMKSNVYSPDELLLDLAKYIADPELDIVGMHIFCFNQVKNAEAWRRATIEQLHSLTPNLQTDNGLQATGQSKF
jgi:methylenetetrahydrofolate reductase (NADPH)